MLIRIVLVAIVLTLNCKDARGIKPSRQTKPPGCSDILSTLQEDAIEHQQSGLRELTSDSDQAKGGRNDEERALGGEVLTEDTADPTPRKSPSLAV